MDMFTIFSILSGSVSYFGNDLFGIVDRFCKKYLPLETLHISLPVTTADASAFKLDQLLRNEDHEWSCDSYGKIAFILEGGSGLWWGEGEGSCYGYPTGFSKAFVMKERCITNIWRVLEK